ncbi:MULTISPECIES: EAL and HDOD domain-containing protein [Vibrio]|uniref:Histidine kinase n=1 Tax=Vibrio genomosp. F6 str. FF-238 TaxID=1191298 RepID=A0A1E5CXG2_9VIBR|nr:MULTISPECIES: EAL domain-containing protein [Vibrio]MDN3698571.1 EAL domain-containing protein [Vibrio cortegadensis]NOH83207.1 EAL domain-containing protein [Vibrio sp. 03-59-1]OEE75378.1 histidine kinase [Vibrio genomosp. F6 str. FF-238]RBW66547.1 EAL domain-containing protein [Vibrionales bacterium C3R12]
MKYTYVARQPILDIDKKTIGYELLFRDGPKNTFPEIDPNLATSRLLSDHFLTTHYSMLGTKLGFVNFPYQSLVNLVPSLFPNHNLIVEILEDCEPDDELFEAIKKLASMGYKLALDDFIPSKAWVRFLPYISIIKFDIRQVSIEKSAVFIQRLANTKIKFLAEKVETYEEYEEAKKAGFHYFQGYFFSKPEMIQRKAMNPNFITIVQLCKEIAVEPINFAEVERLLSCDVTLSFKLLTYVNSNHMITTSIKSFRQALVYLGEQKLRQFVSFVAIASTQERKPDSLYGLAIQRARLCELLSLKLDTQNDDLRGQAFLTGMFSLLDSLLDHPLDQLIDSIPIDDEIRLALTKQEGLLGNLLSLITAYEKAQWDKTLLLREQLGISEEQLAQCCDEAVAWSQDLMSPMQH